MRISVEAGIGSSSVVLENGRGDVLAGFDLCVVVMATGRTFAVPRLSLIKIHFHRFKI